MPLKATAGSLVHITCKPFYTVPRRPKSKHLKKPNFIYPSDVKPITVFQLKAGSLEMNKEHFMKINAKQ
jgi:hypothetical protein